MVGNKDLSFIIDSSFLLSYLLPDENIPKIQQFFDSLKDQNKTLIASLILPFEVLNGLKVAIVKKRIKLNLAEELGRKFLFIPIKLMPVDFMKAFQLANIYDLTFYDASYLYLAKRYRLKLLTLDEKLKKLA